MIEVPDQYRADVTGAAAAAGLPLGIVAAQIWTESRFNPRARSPAGALGIAQFEPGTWASYGHGSPFDPAAAMTAYSAYMAALLRQEHGSVRDALAAYNAGPGNLAAGYGYADGILRLAQEPLSFGAGGGSITGSGVLKNIEGALGGALALPSQLTGLLTALEAPVRALMWIINPANVARVIAGIAGLVLLGAGLITLGMAA